MALLRMVQSTALSRTDQRRLWRLGAYVVHLGCSPSRQFHRSPMKAVAFTPTLAAASGIPVNRAEIRLHFRGFDPHTAVQLILGYQFRRKDLLEEALDRSRSQRLALVGDCVLEMVLVTRLYNSAQDLHRWQETLKYVSNENLFARGVKRNIHHYVKPPIQPLYLEEEGEASKGSKKHVADCMEALVGAVFEDSMGANQIIDWNELDAVIYRLGLIPEFLISTRDRREALRTSRELPRTFFMGHHAALLTACVEHSWKTSRSWLGRVGPLPLRKKIFVPSHPAGPDQTSTKSSLSEAPADDHLRLSEVKG